MITGIATAVTVAIVLGIGWRIYSYDTRLAVVPEIELQLKRLRPPSWPKRKFGLNWTELIFLLPLACLACLVLYGAWLILPSLIFGLIVIIFETFSALATLPPMAIVIGLLVMILAKLDKK